MHKREGRRAKRKTTDTILSGTVLRIDCEEFMLLRASDVYAVT
jgi:hypothetical protein